MRGLVRLSLIQAPILVIGSLIGASRWGAVGAALGFVVAHLIGTLLGWKYLWPSTSPEPVVVAAA